MIALCSVAEFAADPARQRSTAEIAAKYRVSTHHLAKVLRKLARAGLLHVVRGAGGGYRFAGNPKRVTMLDVIALFVDIGTPRRRGARPEELALDQVLHESDETARATFGSITLDTMLKLVARR
jgi:Rrf2 family protein